ncbi:hypothetical protein F5884DRAFT_657755 [Xylogone sp. PMI_703]|nr:hypothetical protein F5884DRAFT_657755 [Xylogone sp. PMI_703]
MHYLSASAIKYPPHDPPIDVSLAQSLGLEPQVIELLQLLPYVEGTGSEDEFIMWGSFLDYRQEGALEQSRDPDYASPEGGFDDENGQYVQPWVIPLSECGNHGSIVYLDTRNSEITMLWQAGGGDGSSDPFFYGKSRSSNKSPHPVNRNRIEHFPSRPAVDFFADFTNRLMTLEWIPLKDGMRIVQVYDSPDSDGSEEWRELKTIYLTFGWPDNFDGPAFDKAMHRYHEFKRVKRFQNEIEDNFKHEKFLLESAIKHHNLHVQRKGPNGVWDNDPNKPADEVQKLEEEARKGEEVIERVKANYEKTKADYELQMTMDADARWEAATMRCLEMKYNYQLNNYEWMIGEGKGRVSEEEIEATKRKVDRVKQRMQDVSKEPRTLMEAITRPTDELDMSI